MNAAGRSCMAATPCSTCQSAPWEVCCNHVASGGVGCIRKLRCSSGRQGTDHVHGVRSVETLWGLSQAE